MKYLKDIMSKNTNLLNGGILDSTDINNLLNEQLQLQNELSILLNKQDLHIQTLKSENLKIRNLIINQNLERGIIKFLGNESKYILNPENITIYSKIIMIVPKSHKLQLFDDNKKTNNLITFTCLSEDGIMYSSYTKETGFTFSFYTNKKMNTLGMAAVYDPFLTNLLAFNYSKHITIELITEQTKIIGDIRHIYDEAKVNSTFNLNITWENDFIIENNNIGFKDYKYVISFNITDLYIGNLTTDDNLKLLLTIPKYYKDTYIKTIDINKNKNDYNYYNSISYDFSDSKEKFENSNFLFSGSLIDSNVINYNFPTLENKDLLYVRTSIFHTYKPIAIFDIDMLYDMRGV